MSCHRRHSGPWGWGIWIIELQVALTHLGYVEVSTASPGWLHGATLACWVYCGSRDEAVASAFAGARFPRVHGHRPLEVCNVPRPLGRSREDGNGGRFVRSPCPPFDTVHQTLSLGPLAPVQPQSIELPATTVGEWRRRHSLRRHKGGLWTVPSTSFHRVLLQCGFNTVARTLWLDEGVLSGLLKDMLTPLRNCNCPAGRHHARSSRGSRDSNFRLPDLLEKVKFYPLGTDPRTGGHRPKDRSSGGIPSGARGYFLTLTLTVARRRSHADMGGLVVVRSAWYDVVSSYVFFLFFSISSPTFSCPSLLCLVPCGVSGSRQVTSPLLSHG